MTDFLTTPEGQHWLEGDDEDMTYDADALAGMPTIWASEHAAVVAERDRLRAAAEKVLECFVFDDVWKIKLRLLGTAYVGDGDEGDTPILVAALKLNEVVRGDAP